MAIPAMPNPAPAIDCEQAKAHIQAVVGGELSVEQRMALRLHAQACEACHADFVGSVETLAALGHEKRLNRVVEEKALRRFELKRCAEQASVPKKLSHARLRTLVYPAFFAILMLALAGRLPFGSGPRVLAEGPGVWIRGHELTVDAGEARIKRGEVLHTEPGGYALLSVKDTQWRMRGQCAVRLEGVVKPTVRLAEGNLELRGAGRCLTEFGILQGQEDCVLELQLHDSGLLMSLSQGAATFVTSAGQTQLLAGQQWQADATGSVTRK